LLKPLRKQETILGDETPMTTDGNSVRGDMAVKVDPHSMKKYTKADKPSRVFN
jgi:hypothetical protein